MTERKLLFLSEDGGYPEEVSVTTDTATLAGMALSGNLALSGGATVTGIPSPDAGTDAANKAYVDAIAAGLTWQEVIAMEVIDDSLNDAPGGETEGDAYIVGDTPAGDWAAFSQGDLIQYISSAWVLILAGGTGEPADGLKIVVTGGTAGGSFVGEENSIGTYDATGDAWSFVAAADGKAVLVHGEGSFRENTGWVYDSSAVAWIQFVATIVAGAGLTENNNVFAVGNGDGIKVNADNIEVELSSTPGLTLEGTSPNKTLAALLKSNAGLAKDGDGLYIVIDEAPDTLDVDGDGLKVVGLPSLFKVNGTAVGVTVTAPNLDDLTDGSNADSLHVHAPGIADEAKRVENTLVNNTAVTAGRCVRYSAVNNQIQHADNTTPDNAKVIGVARVGGAGDPGTSEIVSHGPCASVLSAATVNTAYFLGGSGGALILFGALAAGARVIQVGIAMNGADLFVDIRDRGRKAA